MKRKDCTARERGWPCLDRPDRGIAVFHRKRKAAGHERRAHALVFAFGHAAGRDQRLGAAADRAIIRADPDMARGKRAQPLFADFGTARADVPERLRRLLTPRHAPSPGLDFEPFGPLYPAWTGRLGKLPSGSEDQVKESVLTDGS